VTYFKWWLAHTARALVSTSQDEVEAAAEQLLHGHQQLVARLETELIVRGRGGGLESWPGHDGLVGRTMVRPCPYACSLRHLY
jgi:hypothetical protein